MPGGGSDALSGNLILTVTSIKSYSFSFLPPSKMVREDGVEPPQLSPLGYGQLSSPRG